MDQAKITMDSAQIVSLSAHIRQMNMALNEKLIAIENTIKQIKTEWDSPAGREFAGSFDCILPDFENSTKFIYKYANFLNTAAETYEETEKRINQGASSFSD